MKYRYNNTTITCTKEDKRVIKRLKKHFKVASTNDVINKLIFHYINSGVIDEFNKPILLGVKYYNDMYNK